MHSLQSLFLSATFALGAVTFSPDRDLELFLIMDGDMSSDIINWTNETLISQLQWIKSGYDDAGYSLGVGFAFSSYDISDECGYYLNITTDFGKIRTEIAKTISTYVGDHERKPDLPNAGHRTYNAIRDVIEKRMPARVDERRRVVMLLTDAEVGFGTQTGNMTACSKYNLAAAYFQQVVQDARVAVFWAVQGATVASIKDFRTNQIAHLQGEAGLTDFYVDDNTQERDDFDAIDARLPPLLDATWIATTSTTLSPAALALRQCIDEALKC